MAGERVLVAEDDPLIRRVVQVALARDGFALEVVGDGAEALAAIAGSDSFDCIVLDGMMPRVDGLEVCRRMTQDSRTAHVPVIILSARSQHADQESAFAAGAHAYVIKPFDASALGAEIRRVIARAAAGRAVSGS